MHFNTDYIMYSSMSAFSLTRICTFLFSLARLWSKTDVVFVSRPALPYLLPGALIFAYRSLNSARWVFMFP